LVKEFTYRGLSQKELEELPLDKLFQLFPARARRSLTRGINDNKRKLIKEIKAVKAGELKTTIKTHLRDLLILPYMTGVTVNVFSGKEFLPVVITTQMVGHYLGEFVITNNGRCVLNGNRIDEPPMDAWQGALNSWKAYGGEMSAVGYVSYDMKNLHRI